MAVHDIPKKFKSVSSARKTMAKNILDETGVILATFLPRRATEILDCYLETLRHFNVHLCPIFPTRKVSQVLLLHENVRLCTSACTTEAIKIRWTVLVYQPYSPKLPPPQFTSCVLWKTACKDTHCVNHEALQNAVSMWLLGKESNFYWRQYMLLFRSTFIDIVVKFWEIFTLPN